MGCRTVVWYKANLIFAHYIVFPGEMHESAVNDNAEDFPKVAVDAYPLVVIGVKFVSRFVDGVISPWCQILGKMAELRMMLKSLSIVNWNLWPVYFSFNLGYHQSHRPVWVGGFVFCSVVHSV